MLLQNMSCSVLGPVPFSVTLHRMLAFILITIQTGSKTQVQNLHSVLGGQEETEIMRRVLPFSAW